MKQKAYAWILMFVIIICMPPIAYFFLEGYIDTSNHENRILHTEPELRLDTICTFPQEYELYYNDHLPFRNQLVELKNRIDYHIFHVSDNPNVIIGPDDWLFYYSDGDGNPVKQSLGYWHYTEQELETMADKLSSVRDFFAERGKEFVLLVAPNKESIYKEYIPSAYAVKDEYTSTDQLIDYLREHAGLRVVYPKEELLRVKEEESYLLYQKLDTHWNELGAYIGTQALLRELGIEIPAVSEIEINEKKYPYGDLTNLLGIELKDKNIRYEVSGYSDNEAVNTVEIDGFLAYQASGDCDQRTVYCVRDSFAAQMLPVFSKYFAEMELRHKDTFDAEELKATDADIIIFETAERYLKNYLTLNFE